MGSRPPLLVDRALDLRRCQSVARSGDGPAEDLRLDAIQLPMMPEDTGIRPDARLERPRRHECGRADACVSCAWVPVAAI